tara:strand:+ start:4094 stop:4552 length:459 start_codon:yes stop_codon:yes gene_type:complete
MSKIAISLKVDLSKIDMSKIFNGKNGAQYLDMTAFVSLTELDQYDNSGMITQSVKKEEKEQGIKGNILGNSKVFWVENGQAPQSQQQSQGFQQQAPQQSQGYQAPQQQKAPVNQFNGQQNPQRDSGGFTQAQGGFQQQAPQGQGGFMPNNQG